MFPPLTTLCMADPEKGAFVETWVFLKEGVSVHVCVWGIKKETACSDRATSPLNLMTDTHPLHRGQDFSILCVGDLSVMLSLLQQ